MGRGIVFNVITVIFLLLTALICGYIVINLATQTNPVGETSVVQVPTLIELPSVTPTFTPTLTPVPTDTPTWTPSPTFTLTPTLTFTLPTVPPTNTFTFTPVPSLTPTNTLIPSLEPSATITNTLVPTLTDTPAPTETFGPNLITQEPTVPPPSPFPFQQREQTLYTINFANTAGCLWQGIGGQVFDTQGLPLTGINVHVFGAGIDSFTVSGSNTLYGPSGWEVPVANGVNISTYFVEIQTQAGTIISPPIQVTFAADCARNLALVNFEQTRPY